MQHFEARRAEQGMACIWVAVGIGSMHIRRALCSHHICYPTLLHTSSPPHTPSAGLLTKDPTTPNPWRPHAKDLGGNTLALRSKSLKAATNVQFLYNSVCYVVRSLPPTPFPSSLQWYSLPTSPSDLGPNISHSPNLWVETGIQHPCATLLVNDPRIAGGEDGGFPSDSHRPIPKT